MEFIISFIYPILITILGGFVTLMIYNIKQKRKDKEKRIESITKIMKLTQDKAFTAESMLHKLEEGDVLPVREFLNETIYDYVIESMTYAVHTNSKIYNNVIDYINNVHEIKMQSSIKIETKEDKDKFLKSIIEILNIIIDNGYDLVNTCSEYRSIYLSEYGKKYMKE